MKFLNFRWFAILASICFLFRSSAGSNESNSGSRCFTGKRRGDHFRRQYNLAWSWSQILDGLGCSSMWCRWFMNCGSFNLLKFYLSSCYDCYVWSTIIYERCVCLGLWLFFAALAISMLSWLMLLCVSFSVARTSFSQWKRDIIKAFAFGCGSGISFQ